MNWKIKSHLGQEKKTKNQQNKVYINIIIAVLIKLCTSFLRAVAHDSQQKRHIHQKGGSSHCCTNNIHWATITTQKKKIRPGSQEKMYPMLLWASGSDWPTPNQILNFKNLVPKQAVLRFHFNTYKKCKTLRWFLLPVHLKVKKKNLELKIFAVRSL